MPHSISPAANSPSASSADMEDAAPVGDTNLALDSDAAMEESSIPQAEPAEPAEPKDQGSKKEVKLDELFADVDSDDEFPSARGQDDAASSSPEAPSSPVYVATDIWPREYPVSNSDLVM